MISIEKKPFCDALARCCKVAPSKSLTQILGHVKIVVDSQLTYEATNLALSIRGHLPATGAPDSFTANARELLERCAQVIGDTIKFSRKDGKLTITGEGKRKFTMSCLSVDDFPPIEVSCDEWVEVPGFKLREALEKVLPTVGSDETRLHLNCARLIIGDCKISTASTNGHSVSFSSSKVDTEGRLTAFIPKSTVMVVLSMDSDSVEIGATDRANYFRTGNEILIAKTVENSFPPVEMVLQQIKNSNYAEVDSKKLLSAIQAIRKSGAKEYTVVTISPEEFMVESQTVDGGSEASDSIEVTTEHSGKFKLSSDYLMSALKSCETASFEFGAAMDPIIIFDESEGFKSIIMPMEL